MDIAIVVFDGFDELDGIAPYEVFRNAALAGGNLDASLRTVDADGPVTASHGLEIVADGRLAETDPDLLVLPGGGWNDPDGPGVRAEVTRGALPEAAREHADAGGIVASVCTGGMFLAEAGLLEDRPAITHASALEDVAAAGADVVEARAVDDGDVLTAGGVTAGLDLAFHLVERECGAEVAEAVRTQMEYEPSGDVHVSA